MKPVALKMQAFGPYEEMAEVEFARLGEHSIFLIAGPTGGGKTTILDAMCFALYCRATGGKRKWEEMRNTSAADGCETIVEFSFLLGEDEYRFRRSQSVHKTRGSGVRKIREEHTCYRKADGEWELLFSGSETKVREYAQQLLGLTCEQFSQVIVLPQGDFLKLLRANSNHKAEILQTLFATKLWADITKRCKSLADETTQKLGEYRGAIQAVLEREGVETREALERKNKGLAEECTKKETHAAELQKCQEQHAAELQKGREVLQKLQKQAALKKRWDELQTKQGEMKENQEQLLLGRRVQKVKPYAEVFRQADAEQKQKETAYRKAQQDFERAKQMLSDAEQEGKNIPEWRARADEYSRKHVKLKEAYENAVRVREIAGQLKKKQQEIAVHQKRQTEAEQDFKAAQGRLENGQKYVEQAQEQMQKLPEWMQRVQSLEAEWKRLQEYRDAKAAYEAAQKNFGQAEQEREKCAVQEETLRTRLEQEEARLRQKHAYQLAADLKEGQACPVCGSTHHPSPAGQSSGYDPKQLKQLRESAREFAELLREKERESQLARGKSEQCGAAFRTQQEVWDKQPIDEDVLTAQLQQAKQAYKTCETAAKQFEKYRAAIGKIEKDKDEAQKIREQTAGLLAKLEQEAAVLRASQEEVSRQLGTSASPEQIQKEQEECLKAAQEYTRKVGRAEQQSAAAQTAFAVAQSGQSAAEKADQEARLKLSQACGVLECEAEKAGLSPDLNWESIPADEEFFAGLEQQVTEYEQECHSIQEQRKACREELAGVETPDLKALEDTQKDLQTKAQEAAQVLGSLRRQLETGKQSLAQLDLLSENGREAEERFQQIDRLSKLLQGKNPLKIPLQQFVLGIMFDDVLSCANRFFSMLSQGRYSLRRILGNTGGNALSGLDLEVLDAHAGGARSIETLSGGEQFLASLSLAFGLSDVVQSYSGSVRLDSIFIDEGFGSLDQETLDIAMKALAQIQKLGRTIGIISHVSELKGRIAARLEVSHRTSGGACVKMVCAE